jgi:hypothetical protein
MNSKQLNNVSHRNLLLLGTALVIVGSFLPWEIEGDFVSTWHYGIQIFPAFEDNGGFLVSLVGIFIILLTLRPEGFVGLQEKWILISATALFIISAYHIVNYFVRRVASSGTVGAPAIKIGLILVGIGAILTLATATVMNSRESANNV